MSEITKPDAEEFSQTLEQIGEGWFRQLALGIKLGVPEALGLTRRQWSDRLGVKVRNAEERRDAVVELTDEGLSRRAVGDVLGVADRTVRRDLAGPQSAANAARTSPLPPWKGSSGAAFAASFILSRALIVLMDDGPEADSAWPKLWALSKLLVENARLFPDDARNDYAAHARKRAIISNLEQNHSEIEELLRKNWRPSARDMVDDRPVLEDIFTRVGEMDDVEFWTPLKEHFPKAAAINLGEARR
jgi:hypothetical protein